ncbi:MAG: nickel pincer cofactor biosynthesis protein LarB [Burkholderiales bacterium]|nr:nickel pincer cofactor biosynthesis protein LarB [Burkholderiales bacterium]
MADDFRFDWDRAARTGTSEAVLCDGKSEAQIAAIVQHVAARSGRLLLTRLAADRHAQLPAATRGVLDYDEISRTAFLGPLPPLRAAARVAIVCGGTSDVPVAIEAERTLRFAGEAVSRYVDVGVAGLWRLMEHLDDIRAHHIVLCVAGMEGALFSVLTGLVASAVIAVPTSVGYGVAAGGRAALHSALASCASGLAVVNIDNGFGAAHVALRMLGAHAALADRGNATGTGSVQAIED